MLENSCVSIDLKTGSLIIAGISLSKQLGMWLLTIVIFLAVALHDETASTPKPDTYRLDDIVSMGKLGTESQMHQGLGPIQVLAISIVSILIIPHFVSVILLIIGIIREKAILMLPWLIISAVFILIPPMTILGAPVKFGSRASIYLLFMFINLLLDLYTHFVVLSYYMEIS